jgi:hypothetical protein
MSHARGLRCVARRWCPVVEPQLEHRHGGRFAADDRDHSRVQHARPEGIAWQFHPGPADGIPQQLPLGLGIRGSVAADAQGGLHACATPRSTSWLDELAVDGAGAVTGAQVLDGDVSRFCMMLTDSQQKVHMAYGGFGVYLDATRD